MSRSMLDNGSHVLGNGPLVLGNGPYLCTKFMNTEQGYSYYGEVRLGRWFILAPIGLGNFCMF